MKRIEIENCVKTYRVGVEAYAQIEAVLDAAFSGTEEISKRIPRVREARERLAEVKPSLELLGEALAYLPEIAAQLTEERRISASFRRQGQKHGVKYRYDAKKRKPDMLRDEADCSENI